MRKQIREILAVLKGIYRLLEHRKQSEEVNPERTDVDFTRLMTRMAVIAKLGISERTYNRWVKSGVLKPIELGNKHFYRDEDLRDAMRRSINKGLL